MGLGKWEGLPEKALSALLVGNALVRTLIGGGICYEGIIIIQEEKCWNELRQEKWVKRRGRAEEI